jgi:nucleotide-binding universal stress UspA family protein
MRRQPARRLRVRCAYGVAARVRLNFRASGGGGRMFKHILIPTDGSDLSRKAVLYGVQLAKEAGAKVTALTTAEPYRVASSMDAVLVSIGEDEYEEESRRISEKALEQVKMAAEAAGVPCETIREVHDQPYRAIIDAAHALSCDLIVMASHGRRGISALLLGSETVKVLTHSTIPVLVYR